MASINKVAGEGGCDLQVGAGTYTPSGRHSGKKIHAIGVHTAANITNFKYTPKGSNGRDLAQATVTADAWIGIALVEKNTTAYIPLGVSADEVVVASGDVMMYFD
jgi:hypothetical protein